ncbi:MAG: argininosuccinate lyase [Candidatus Omnitrophica bacterium]|nr:argininosuccinate lyase [Candidatus Omnitrophota bacterium]
MARKLWGGRFRKPTDPVVARFTSSIAVDHRLARYDVVGSIAHARMLGKCGIIPQAEANRLVRGLERLLRVIEQGTFKPDPSAEDIHTQVQQMLTKLIGPVAEKLQTARSRNDQVALDLRLYCRDAAAQARKKIRRLQQALVDAAQRFRDVVIPGYTHLQRAQPVLLAHHLLAYVEMLQRDHDRLGEALARINVLPLGAGALAGTSLPIDRHFAARQLKFARVSDNSLDAVSDRDFAVELLGALSLLAVHLSRFAEDAILWATEEFGILELDDAFATGSSLMPQKKNPDVLELIRGQAGVVAGGWVSLLSVLKGLPLAYNRDLQWDKLVVFQAVDLVQGSLTVLERLIRHVDVRRDRIDRLLESDALCATDLAEHLVRKGVPFRQAHEIVGGLVLSAERRGVKLGALRLAELKRFSTLFDEEAQALLNPRRSVEVKLSWGGTSPQSVKQAIGRWRKQFGA